MFPARAISFKAARIRLPSIGSSSAHAIQIEACIFRGAQVLRDFPFRECFNHVCPSSPSPADRCVRCHVASGPCCPRGARRPCHPRAGKEAVARAMMHAHFEHAAAHRSDVPGIVQRDVSQTCVDSCNRASVAQATNPALERGAFNHVGHSRKAHSGSHSVKPSAVTQNRPLKVT